MISESKYLLSQAYHLACRWKYQILTSIICIAALTIALFPYDKFFLSSFLVKENSPAENAARALSLWGDFQTGTCIAVLLLFLAGKIFKKEYWRRVAIACFLAASLAGITVNCISFAAGRPRPYVKIEDRFYGICKSYSFHSFPSGHSATSFGTATMLSVAFPPLAIPALLTASSIAWSRMALNRHYPSDILAGSFIGILCGILLGAAARSEQKITGDTKRQSSPNSSAQN